VTSTDIFASEQISQDKQQEVRAAKEAIAGPVPLIEDAPDPVVVLPRGLFHNGIWEKEATCRELTGADEEALAKVVTPYAYFNSVLALGTVSIGSFDLSTLAAPEREYYLGDLLLGEREQLFLKIVQVSFGNVRKMGFTCTMCSEPQDVDLLLDTDFPPKKVENVEVTTLDHTTSKGDVVTYRGARGQDQEEVLSKKGINVAEQSTMMIARCITKVNGEILPDPQKYARSLSIRDRQKLLELLVERQPSIDLDITTTCASCGAQQSLSMGWADFFRS
jgi:T4 bacteriophage base plate protein